MRLGDLDTLEEILKNYCVKVEVNKNSSEAYKISKVVQAVQDYTIQCIKNQPTIDPETLPIVQELKEQLEAKEIEKQALRTAANSLKIHIEKSTRS